MYRNDYTSVHVSSTVSILENLTITEYIINIIANFQPVSLSYKIKHDKHDSRSSTDLIRCQLAINDSLETNVDHSETNKPFGLEDE